MPNKPTDKEIVKALECCNNCDCGGCPCLAESGCKDIDYAEILDLINRLQAENERLRANEEMAEGYADALEERAKAEARKEFAERLKEIMCQDNEIYIACAKNMLSKDFQRGYEEKNDDVIKHIDNLLKEMESE